MKESKFLVKVSKQCVHYNKGDCKELGRTCEEQRYNAEGQCLEKGLFWEKKE